MGLGREHQLMLVAMCLMAMVQADSKVLRFPTEPQCPQPGQEAQHGMCERDKVPFNTGQNYQCVEMLQLKCPQRQDWVQEGTECVQLPASVFPSLAFNCTSGKWTRTDAVTSRQHREKRLAWLIPLVVGVGTIACMIFCPKGPGPSPSPPPNKPPKFTRCPKDIKVTAPAGKNEAKVSWEIPKATDPDGGTPSVRQRNGPKPGSIFPKGRTFIMYEARDKRGSTDICPFQVVVDVVYCSVAPAPVNGKRPDCSGAQEENQFGATCQFSCHTGHDLQGQGALTCQGNKKWSHPFPTCSPVSCGDPGSVTGGSVQCLNGHRYPAWCSVLCKAGYRHAGAPYTSCTAGAAWTPVQGCEDKEAPTFPHGCPPDIQDFSGPLGTPVTLTWDDPVTIDNSGENATVTSEKASGSSFPPGLHTVKVTATDSAGNSRSCKFFVDIQERRCQSLFMPEGRLTCDHGNLEGSKCTASCNRGYEIQGQATVTCQQNGTWIPELPTCEKVTCPAAPPAVKGGDWLCHGRPQYESSCSLKCDPGYTAVAPEWVTCGADGQWSPPGTCQDTESPALNCPDSVEVFASRLGEDTIVTWDLPTVTDNSGDNVSATSDVMPGSSFDVGVTRVTYTATDASGNSGTCLFYVIVTTRSCASPDMEDPGRARTLMLYQCPDGYVHGAQCTLNCTSGYPLQGSSTITCELDDSVYPPLLSWIFNGTSPECIENRCPELDPPENGALSCLLGNAGWDCFMSCNENWDIPKSFDGRFICTNSDGFWKPNTVLDCTEAFVPRRAKLPSEFYYFTQSCNMSFQQIRENFITALQNSAWKDACVNVPTCTVENVQVTCGPFSRRRRSVERKGESGGSAGSEVYRQRRQASGDQALVISFDIVMDFVQNGTAEATFQAYKDKEGEIHTTLKTEAQNGVFDLGSLTPDPRYQYTSLTFDGCPNGTKYADRYDSARASCVGCSKGHYLQGEQCEECPVGQYTELDNATSCTDCPPGFSTLTTASDSRDDCKEFCRAGHFSPTGFVPCLPCPAGQYLSRDQDVTCDLCPVGTWTELAGAISRNDCVAADVRLSPNVSLSTSLTSQQPSVTALTWVKLEPNSSLTLKLQLSAQPNSSLSLVIVPQDVNDASQNLTLVLDGSLQVPVDQWIRIVMVTQTGGGGVTVSVFRDDQHLLDTPLPPLPTPFTAQLTATVQRGRGLLAGVHGEQGGWSREKIRGASSSCTDHLADNLLTWTPQPTAVHVPSLCDAVDECRSSPCGPQAVCKNQPAGYVCHCQQGWSGPTCQVPPDACLQHQCQNGARCVPAGHNYSCECHEKNAGQFCQLEKVHGEWGEWGEWSQCSQTCGGQHHRQRHCNNPAPSNGGDNCPGPAMETENCGEAACSVDGEWSMWSEWSSCSATCGGGETTRSRRCDNPVPQNGGAPCSGMLVETETCATAVCPVHGGWGIWSAWSPCSVTCGNGVQSRERSCDNPYPADEGQPCQGSYNQTRLCNLAQCPVCSELPEVHGTIFNCSETAHPYRKTCRVTCYPGYSTAIPTVYLCGQETGYLWDFERNEIQEAKHAIQYCSPMKTPTLAASSTYVPLPGADCGRKDTVWEQVDGNLKVLPCLEEGKCQVKVQVLCDSSSSSNKVRRKRSTAPVTVKVDLTADLGETITVDGADNSTVQEFVNVFTMVDRSAAMIAINDTDRLFTVTVDDVTITPDVNASSYTADLGCPPGASLSSEGGCVDCPAGFYEEGGECLVCPLGQYQDLAGSTSCKSCPNHTSWDSPGASDLSQCYYSREDEIPSAPEASNTGIIIGACIGAGLALIVIITIIVVYLLKKQKTKPVVPSEAEPKTVLFDNKMYEVPPL